MVQLNDPIRGLEYALAQRRLAQQNAATIGAPIGEGISRGIALGEARRRDRQQQQQHADEMAMRNAQYIDESNYHADREARLAADADNARAYRDKMLALKEQEMYGGREIPAVPAHEPSTEEITRSIVSDGAPTAGIGMPGTPATFEPTIAATAAGERSARAGRGEVRAGIRLAGQMDDRQRRIRGDRIKAKEARLAEREKRLAQIVPDANARAAFMAVPKGEARRFSGAFGMVPQGYEGTAPGGLKEFYSLLDEVDALRADLDAERAAAGADGSAASEAGGEDWIGEVEDATED